MRCSSVTYLLPCLLAFAGASAAGAQDPSPAQVLDAADADTLPALDAALSPDGRVVAFRATRGGAPRLFVMEAFDSLGAARPLTPADASVGHYAWAPDSRHLVFTSEEGRGLRVVRHEGGPPGAGAAPDAGVAGTELVAEAEGAVRIAGFAPDPVAVLVELPGRWPDAPDLVRVELDTGVRTVVVRNEGGVRHWIPGPSGAPRLGIREDEDGGTEVVRYREGELVPVYRCAADERCDVVGFHVDGRAWLRSDPERAAPALVLLDPLTSAVERVRADLSDDPRAAFRDDSTSVEAMSSVRELVGADATLTFQEGAAGGGRHLVYVRGPEGGRLLLLDRWSGVVEELMTLAEMPPPPVMVTSADASVLVPVRLAYRITEEGSLVPPIEMARRIERATQDGEPVWRVVDEADVPTFEMPGVDMDMDVLADDPEAIDDMFGDDPSFDPFAQWAEPSGRARATDTTVLDGSRLVPLRRQAEGTVRIELDFREGRVSGVTETEGFETSVDVEIEGPVWSEGAALETLMAALPLEEGYRMRVPVLETQTAALDTVEVAVRGTKRVTTAAGSFDTWRLAVSSSSTPDREEVWFVRRAAPHYLVRAEARFDDLVQITELTDAGGLP